MLAFKGKAMDNGIAVDKPMEKTTESFTEFIRSITSFFELFNIDVVAGRGSKFFESEFEVLI